MKKILAILVLTFCIISGCDKTVRQQGDISFAVDNVYERGPLTLHVKVDKSAINLSQTVQLRLEAALKQGYEIKMPNVAQVLRGFGIVDTQNLGSRLGDNDNITTTVSYRLEPFLPGKISIPALQFEFYDANAPDKIISRFETEPIEIEVTSVLEADSNSLAIADIEDVVEMPSNAVYWYLLAVLALLLIISGLIWFRLRRKKLEKLVRIYRPAHEIAYLRLRVLQNENLIQSGRIKEFYERISDILRHYIEDRFELRAPERTTEEFLNELSGSEQLRESDKKDLGRFLEHCDLVKFAKYDPTNEQIQKTFDLAEGFIEKTKSDEHKIDVTDSVELKELLESESL